MPLVYKEVEVHVELDDFSTNDLIDELNTRLGVKHVDETVKDLVRDIWAKRRLGKDFGQELDQLIYEVEGKIL